MSNRSLPTKLGWGRVRFSGDAKRGGGDCGRWDIDERCKVIPQVTPDEGRLDAGQDGRRDINRGGEVSRSENNARFDLRAGGLSG